jgi:hypothetical protein
MSRTAPANLNDTLVDDHVAIARRFGDRPLGVCCVFSTDESQDLRQNMPTLGPCPAPHTSQPRRPAPLRSPVVPPMHARPLPPPDMPIERRNPVVFMAPEQVAEMMAAVRRRNVWRQARAAFALVFTCSAIGALISFALRVMHST